MRWKSCKNIRSAIGILVLFITIIAGIAYLASCSGGSSTGSTKGSVALLLADGPADDYSHIWITVTEVSLIPAGNGAPVVIFSSSSGLRVDLLNLQKEDYLVTIRNDISTGLYSKIRLGVSKIEPEGGPCADMTVKLPSGRIDLNPSAPFRITAGGMLAIRLDIDANKSINLHEAGNSGQCIFRPVVFVDIQEQMPTNHCPKVLTGTITSLKLDTGNQVVGFSLNLQDNRGTINVNLSSNTELMNNAGTCISPNDLSVNDPVNVRGKLAGDGTFDASLVVEGAFLDVTGTAIASPAFSGSTFSFNVNLDANQELVGQYTVQGQSCTTALTGCDTPADPNGITAGMAVRILGKLVSSNGQINLIAAAIFLEKQEIDGQITAITPSTGGVQATILPSVGTAVSVFVPDGTPLYLQGDGTISQNLLCVGRQVSVLLMPGTMTADRITVQPTQYTGMVLSANISSNTMTVDLGGGNIQTVYVEPGATILKSTGDSQSLASFGDIKVNDSITYFGLVGCGTDTQVHAFVIIDTTG